MLLAIAFVLHTGLVLCVCMYPCFFFLLLVILLDDLFLLVVVVLRPYFSPFWKEPRVYSKSIRQAGTEIWLKKYQKVQTTRNCMCTYERCFCWTNTSNMPGCIRFSGTVPTGGPLIGSTDAKDWYRVELIHHAFQIPCALRHWKHESEPAKLVKGTVTFKQDIAKTYENKTLYLKVLRIFHSCCILKYIDGRQWSARISRFP